MSTPNAPLTLSLPARAENIALVRHVLGGVAEALDLGPDLLDDIRLAVSEACANVVVHAYADTPGQGSFDVEIAPGGEAGLSIVVRDRGRGMGPRPDSPGLGVGLPLIAALASALEIGTSDDGATEVRMTFATGPEAEADSADSVAA